MLGCMINKMDDEYQKTNREKTMSPRKNKFWCHACDKALASEHTKCPECGHRNGIKRYKK